ncbi:MAG TPA: STAS domain-containing protein [Bacteroidia bacterium]|nr:STAS domain-containing protein [Bacteroidia bacterium]
MMAFEYTQKEEAEIIIMTLKGELIDKNQTTEMMLQTDALIAAGKNKFILDLSELKYVNSSGLNVLIHILTRARKSGGDVAIAGVSKKVNELLLITKLNTIFNISDSIANAITLLKNQ